VEPIPLVYENENVSSVVKNIIASLETLSQNVDNTFDRILKISKAEQSRLEYASSRLENYQSIIPKIRGTRRATSVFSSSKHPAPIELQPLESIFVENIGEIVTDLTVDSRNAQGAGLDSNMIDSKRAKKITIESEHITAQNANPTIFKGDSLQLFTINTISKNESKRVEFIMEDEGLGELPDSITSMGSLLLFNTKINPYKAYKNMDNLLSIYDR